MQLRESAQRLQTLRDSRVADPSTVTSRQIVTAENAVTRARQNALVARQRLNAADVEFNRLANRNLRTLRGIRGAFGRLGSSLLSFVGGPWGALLTALSVGATAWAIFGGRVNEAEERNQSLLCLIHY